MISSAKSSDRKDYFFERQRGEMKELSRVRSTLRFLAYITTVWWVELIMKKKTLEEGQVLQEKSENQLRYNESNIYMAIMNTLVKEV